MIDGVERVFVLLGPKGPNSKDSWIQQDVADLVKAGRLPQPKVFRAITRRFTEVGEGGRRVHVLRPQDAAVIYVDAHRAPTLVITAASVRILLDPRKDPASPRTVCRPAAALRHKAVTWTVQDSKDLASRVAGLLSPHPCDDIEGLRDPRVLPLHLFQCPDDEGHLGTVDGRGRFVEQHRQKGTWVGPKGRWQDAPPGARHGMDRVTGQAFVSGWQVPLGHHWDVQPANDKTELVGFDVVWWVRRGGHVNVFPDGHLLGKHRAGRAWPPG